MKQKNLRFKIGKSSWRQTYPLNAISSSLYLNFVRKLTIRFKSMLNRRTIRKKIFWTKQTIFRELMIGFRLDLKLNETSSNRSCYIERQEKGKRGGTEIFGSNSKSCMPMTRCIGYSSDKTLRGKVGRNSSWQIVKTSSPRHKGNHYYP